MSKLSPNRNSRRRRVHQMVIRNPRINHKFFADGVKLYAPYFDYAERVFDEEKITWARGLSDLHQNELQFHSGKLDMNDDVYIRWSSPYKVHISGVKDKVTLKVRQIKSLVFSETVCRTFLPSLYRILSTEGVFNELSEKFGNELQIEKVRKNEVGFTGSKTHVAAASAFLTKKSQEINKLPLQLHPYKLKYLKLLLDEGDFSTLESIEMVLRDCGLKGCFSLDGDEVVFVTMLSTERIRHLTLLLDLSIEFSNLGDTSFGKKIDEEGEWICRKNEILNQFNVRLIVPENQIIAGMRLEIQKCIEEFDQYDSELIITPTPVLCKYMLKIKEKIIQECQADHVDVISSDPNKIYIKGRTNDVRNVRLGITQKADCLVQKHFEIHNKSCLQFLQDTGMTILEDIENEYGCCIEMCEKVEEIEDVPSQTEAFNPNVLKSLRLSTDGGLAVEIQLFRNSNFLSHRCDVMVHPYNPGGGLSDRFLDKVGTAITDKVRSYMRQNPSRINPLLTESGNISCWRHIIHTQYPRSTSNQCESDKLNQCISNIFTICECKKAGTVAIILEANGLMDLRSVMLSVARYITEDTPLFLKQVHLLVINWDMKTLMEEFSSIESEISRAFNAKKISEGLPHYETKTVVLQRVKNGFSHHIFPSGQPTKISWMEYIRKRTLTAMELKSASARFHIPSTENSAEIAQWTKEAIEQCEGMFPSKFILSINNGDMSSVSSFEKTFLGIQDDFKGNNKKPQNEIKIGEIKITVKTGDILEEDTDAIVNSTNRNFNLNQGALSKRILHEAGRVIATECSSIKEKGIRVTGAGSLRCKNIIHAVVTSNEDELKQVIIKILKEANQLHLKSLSIPAIGTGNLGLSNKSVAEKMREAVEHFVVTTDERIILQSINIVLMNEATMNTFIKQVVDKPYLRKTTLEETVSQIIVELLMMIMVFLSSLFTWIFEAAKYAIVSAYNNTKSDFYREVEVDFRPRISFCHENREVIDKAMIKLRDVVLKNKMVVTVHGVTGDNLTEWDKWKIKSLEKQLHVRILVRKNSGILIEGFGNNSSVAKKEIEKMLDERKKYTELKVMWMRGFDGNWKRFDQRISHMLEKGFEKREATVHVQDFVSNYVVEYDIHFADMCSSLTSTEASLRRTCDDSSKLDPDLPNEWEGVGNVPISIPLDSKSVEFVQVQEKVSELAPLLQIVSVQRIQNKTLFKQYKAKKDELFHKHSDRKDGIILKRTLFHGTSNDSIDKIIKSGFNRSYSGKNATRFGHGSYFAVDPKYSDRYTQADETGLRTMFMVNVLTGEFTKGKESDKVLPIKAGSNETYDSLVNDVKVPTIFVVFHDSSAYPTYLIHYRRVRY
uniref:uncharacterized protein LOC120341249 n=1 Tax=Styela clava TaxID=7725 RepID=UPI00193A1E57|nr:uncharacterized protein LOC120341249 [Styela clava]